MEELLARGRIYVIVIVFFSSCFLGLMSGVSTPMLAIRSIVITIIVGVLSNLFVKYVSGVAKTVVPDGVVQNRKPVSAKTESDMRQSKK